MNATKILTAGYIALSLCLAGCRTPETSHKSNRIMLFDGQTPKNWKKTDYGGQGEVTVENNAIVLDYGNYMTGITWNAPLPAKKNYEITLEANRLGGSDFFCGLTFPVRDSSCTLIVGGWGGYLVGLSSIDGYDASDNETMTSNSFDNNRWYHIRLRVTDSHILAWIDDIEYVNFEYTGHDIDVRYEVEPNKPLGFSTWRTRAALRNIQMRKIRPQE